MKESLWQDIQLGVRLMFKYPVFSLIAIISLGLGIGANTAIFSVTNALMFRPLPVIRNNDDLAWVFSTIRQGTKPISVSYKNYIDIRDENSVFSGITAFSGVPLSINSYGKAELVSGEIVSANYFSVLGVNASVGRTFLSDEDRQPGANTVIVISDGLWRRRFGADPSVAGRSIVLNGLSFTIVGVAPKGFFGAEIGSLPEVWVPMSMHDQLVLPAARYLEKGAPKLFEDRKEGWLNVIGRLKPGVSMAQALADLKTVASNLNRAHMEANKGVGITIYPLKGGLDPRERGEFLPVAAVLMAVVGVVLLIVCNNLASLLLARSSAREKEIGIRLSLGASRIRLVQQLLTESMVIGVVGGILGLVLAFVTSDAVAALTSVPIDARPDIRVFLFALILSTVAVGAFGLAPAIHASQSSPVTALKGSMGTTEPGRHRLRNLLVIAQITLSLAMLICGGLFLGSVRKSGSVDTGFYAKQGLVVPLDLGLQNYSEDRGRVFYGELLGSVSTQANVQAASLTEYMPLDPNSFGQAIVTVEGKPPRPEDQDAFRAGTDTVEPNYFGTIGIPILKGRAFTQQDRAGSPKVAIVNETMARRFWPNSEAIGNRFSISGIKGPYYEVVGVAKDGSYRILGEKPQPYLYTALGQNYVSNMTLVVRTANDPARTLESIRSVIHEMDSNLPLSNVRSLKQLVNQSLLPARAAAMLLGAFGVLALILAAAGIYGVTACTVSQRTREIGIRIALGAQRNDVLRLVLREESVTVAVGIILGLALGLGASKVIHSFIFGILSGDVVTFVLVPAVLIGVAFLAGYLPARKATRVSPAIAMNI